MKLVDGAEVLEPGDEGFEVPADETETTEVEDRGDVIASDEDDELEVDADVLAQLAADETTKPDTDPKKDSLYKERRLLQEENARLKAELEAMAAPVAAEPAKEEPPAFDIDAKEAEYADAVIEGDVERAKGLRKEIRQFEQAAMKDELRREQEQADRAKTVGERMTAVITQAFTDHPELNHKSDVYNPNLVGKINLMAKAYEAQGKPADEALSLAIEDFIPKKEAAAEVDPEVAKNAAAAAALAKKRNAIAAASQPPGLGGVGTGERAAAGVRSIEDMTDAEFNALPEREKKRLRGD